jgi:outer membrane protein assembly factor BamD
LTELSGTRGRTVAIWLLLLGTCLALGAGSGCGTSNPYSLGSFERGTFWLERGRFQEAAEAFEIFVRQNPTDSLAAQAQFEKARAYMEIKEYPLAAVELQILRQDFPISPLVEDAMYLEGWCYYNQIGRIERDVTPAYEARVHWLEFARTYPTSKYMPEVRLAMQEIADLMVLKQLRAAKVYEQLGRWEAVGITLERILEQEPSSSLLDQVLWKRAKVAERLDDPNTAMVMYQRLVDGYPDSEYRERSQKALGKLLVDADEP